MAEKSPFGPYAQLFQAAVVGLAIVGSVGDYRYRQQPPVAIDVNARKDPWSGSDQKAYAEIIDLRLATLTAEIEECRRLHYANDEKWRVHKDWGVRIAGENEVQLDFILRDIQTLQDQVFDLYTTKTKD